MLQSSGRNPLQMVTSRERAVWRSLGIGVGIEVEGLETLSISRVVGVPACGSDV